MVSASHRPTTRSVYQHAVHILVSLYLLQVAIAVILVGIYKAPVYDRMILATRGGIAIGIGLVALVGAGWLLIRRSVAAGSSFERAFGLALTTNVLSGLVAFLLLEATTRMVAKDSQERILIGSVIVRPNWPELRTRSRKFFAGLANWDDRDTSYFVYDRELGWTVGPNRKSKNGLYFSSTEGIRSGGPNVRMADQSPRFRVALIGDSNAFSFEVPFEQSWGYYLQQFLGDDVQVLNFGVDGYGIDQMYLRFQRDVRPWNPQVVLIGFIAHDLKRAMAVYPFVSFEWPGYLVKPRFAMENGEPRLLNVPLPAPDEIFKANDIQSLPFVQYDLGYGSAEWYWRFDHGPLFLRYLTSVVPRWSVADPRVSEETSIELNSALLTQLVKSVEKTGAVPLLVALSPSNTLLRETIKRAGVAVMDATKCLVDVPVNLRNVPSSNHYTGLSNQAIARCTAPVVDLALPRTRAPAEGRSGPRLPFDLGGEGIATARHTGAQPGNISMSSASPSDSQLANRRISGEASHSSRDLQ